MPTESAKLLREHGDLVRRMAGRFWRERLQCTAVERRDVEQEAWLALVAHPEAVGGLRPKRVTWSLQRAFTERGRAWELWGPVPGLARELAGEPGGAPGGTTCRLHLEYLHQNLWAVGTPKMVEALGVWLEGGRVDANLVRRALPRLRQAYPSKEALLGPSLAAWMHSSCVSALAAYARGAGVEVTVRDGRGRLRRLTQPARKPCPDARAFYDRQLSLGWRGEG